MYKKAMVIMGLLLLTSCVNSPTTRGGGSSNYATRDVKLILGDRQTYPRVALVIGNNDYEVGRKLTNAVPDSRAIRDFLISKGFKVIYAENADIKIMREKKEEFIESLGKKSIAVVYYSGHANQDKSEIYNGELTNYLIPINNSKLKSITNLDYNSLSLNQISTEMNEKNHGLNIVMLDACRTTFGRTSNTPMKSIGAEGVYTVYSTLSGLKASDNGLFRKSFIQNAKKPLKLSDIFENVQMELNKISQRASILNETVGTFYFTKVVKPISTLQTMNSMEYKDKLIQIHSLNIEITTLRIKVENLINDI